MHDKRPTLGDAADEESRRAVRNLASSDYATYARALSSEVSGKVVETTIAGRSGFVLRFTDGDWVASFLEIDRLSYVTGSGAVPDVVLQRIDSAEYADGAPPVLANLPYARERCDFAAELRHCVGQPVVGLSIGADCFNFCFPDGRELDTHLVHATDGRLALRLFWEQW